MTISRQHRILKISKRIALLLTAGMVFVPCLFLLWAATNSYVPDYAEGMPINIYIRLGTATAMIPMILAVMFGLNALRKLFNLYAHGSMFGQENVAAIRQFSLSLLLYSLVLFTSESLEGILLALPTRTLSLAIGISGAMVVPFLTGIALLVISWVMDEARKIHDEQSLTV